MPCHSTPISLCSQGGLIGVRSGLDHVSGISSLCGGTGVHILEPLEFEGFALVGDGDLGADGVVSVDLCIGHSNARLLASSSLLLTGNIYAHY